MKKHTLRNIKRWQVIPVTTYSTPGGLSNCPWGMVADDKQPWASFLITSSSYVPSTSQGRPMSNLWEKPDVFPRLAQAVTSSCSCLLFSARGDHFNWQSARATQFLFLLTAIDWTDLECILQHCSPSSSVNVAGGKNNPLKTLQFVFYSVSEKNYSWF